MVPASLKEAAVGPLFKKPTLDPIVLWNYHLLSNTPLFTNVVGSAESGKLQEGLDDTAYLYSIQLGFLSHCETK